MINPLLSGDQDFLSAMAASPHDWSVRLAHADWLEERGDPRAELVRLTYEVLHGRWGESGLHSRLAKIYQAGLILPTPQVELTCGLTLRLIPPGSFTMGSPEDEKDRVSDENQASVTLTRGFWLGQYTVTLRQWKEVMGSEPWSGRLYVQSGDDYPATYVSWEDAQEFCVKLTERERLRGGLGSGLACRLPTEAEWEYACRAGTTSAYSFGEDLAQLERYAWYDENTNDIGEQYAHRVGQRQANPWGLFDMHGNVWEWCQDVYVPSLQGRDDPLVSTGGSYRSNRGGSWRNTARRCRSANRSRNESSNRNGYLGFRVAAVPSGQ